MFFIGSLSYSFAMKINIKLIFNWFQNFYYNKDLSVKMLLYIELWWLLIKMIKIILVLLQLDKYLLNIKQWVFSPINLCTHDYLLFLGDKLTNCITVFHFIAGRAKETYLQK